MSIPCQTLIMRLMSTSPARDENSLPYDVWQALGKPSGQPLNFLNDFGAMLALIKKRYPDWRWWACNVWHQNDEHQHLPFHFIMEPPWSSGGNRFEGHADTLEKAALISFLTVMADYGHGQ